MNLTPVERDILEYLLLEGDDRPVNISEKTERHRGSVSRSCGDLVEKGLVAKKGNGVYRLTNPGILAAQNITKSTGRES